MKLLITEDTSFHYTNEDYAHMFYHFFFEYVKSKNPSVTPRTSVSFLLKKYLESFLKDYNLSEKNVYRFDYYGKVKGPIRTDVPISLGRELVEKGIVDFDKFTNDFFFTKRFRKLIKRILEINRADKVFKINFIEDEPLNVKMLFDVDWDNILRNSIPNDFPHTISQVTQNLKNELNEIGFEYGNPDYGLLSIEPYYLKMGDSYDQWIKNFAKKLRTEIKTTGLDEFIKSTSFSRSESHLIPINVKVTLKDASDYDPWRRSHNGYEFRGEKMNARTKVQKILDELGNLISEMGYESSNFKIESPTLNRV